MIKPKEIIILTLFLSSIGLVISGSILSFGSQLVYNENLVEDNFASILLNIKHSQEIEFQELLDEIKNDPLEGLYDNKLPTAEEIFYEEWANDWFPAIDIPLIGGYIQAECAEIIGDINLDNQAPEADLNISSRLNPSGITMEQCNSLWNRHNSLSLVTTEKVIWLGTLNTDDYDESLMFAFNLSEYQLYLIKNWINVSQQGWMRFYAKEAQITINPIFLSGSIAIGVATLFFANKYLRSYFKRKNLPQSEKQ